MSVAIILRGNALQSELKLLSLYSWQLVSLASEISGCGGKVNWSKHKHSGNWGTSVSYEFLDQLW